MSGIVGILRPTGGAVDRAEIVAMLDTIPHRSRDGRAAWSTGGVGLGHATRHFTPEDRHESWPLLSPDGKLCLVADARLDNRDELAAALDLGRHERGFFTDGELILGAFRRWGEECATRLLGDFAFAVWDAERRFLFLARDHFGAKPLFYHRAGDGSLVFGSEIKTLFAGAEISRAPSEHFIAAHFLVPVAEDGASTYYEAVRALAPAHTLTIGPEGEPRIRQYWRLDDTSELRLGSAEEYAEGFRERFEAAVRARLRSVSPVGVTLSGGLDSSSIASVAAKMGSGPIHSYSAVFNSVPSADERRYQRSVAETWGLAHSEYVADAGDPLSDHPDIIRHVDGWPSGGNLRLNWNLYQLASEQGVRVMLEGFDGDTVVSHGLGYFGELAQRQEWYRLAVEVGGNARIKGLPVVPTIWSWWSSFRLYPMLRNRGLFGYWMKLERVARALTGGRQQPPPPPRPWARYLDPDFVARVHRPTSVPLPPTERAHHVRTLTGSLNAHITETLNGCGAAFGIDVRYPFFDRRLVEYCVSLPPEQKIRRGLTRLVLRRAMQGTVPALVLSRTDKTNLEPALDHALRSYTQPLLQSVLRTDALEELSTYINVGECREIFRRYDQGVASEMDRFAVWVVLVLLVWQRETAVFA